MMKPKITLRSWVRTILFSVLAAFAVQGIANPDEIKTAFERGSSWQKNFSNMQASTPDCLRVPEIIAGAIGKFWQWIH